MPRGRPRKNADPVVAAEIAKPEVAADPVDSFREALNRLIDSDPEAANKIMAAVMGVAAGTPRKIDERVRKVTLPRPIAPIAPEPPPPPKPGVVFASRHGAFRYVLERGGSKYDAMGNREVIGPRLLDCDAGMARLTNPEDIAKVRAFIDKQRRLGVEPQLIELRDEISEAMEAGRKVVPIQSLRVTADTPLSELVVQ